MEKLKKDITNGIFFTDQYQLTMAHLYYRMGLHEKEVQFDHFFRSYPDYGEHKAGYCINAGLAWLLDWMQSAKFHDREINYLRKQKGRTGERLFEDGFLEWLRAHGSFDSISMQAIPEGRVVHANEPLTVVQGPMAMAQILETSLLNHLNFQTLIATKASRIKNSGHGQLLIDFGLRRAQEKGGNAGARGALIGGADFTSNVGASAALGYPPKGTHAHSMVQVFMALGESELDAFKAYADVYPDDCLLLVDTIDTLESGIPNAIKVFEMLRKKGHEPMGIRLDSGDLAYLSIQAAKMLNKAGFPDVSIVLSNQLDEMNIWQIITQIQDEAPKYDIDPDKLIKRLSYGVGTRLITSWNNPALDGVYKLVSVRDKGEWQPAIKVSETKAKIPNPGQKKLWRIYDKRNKATADLLTLDKEKPKQMKEISLHHPIENNEYRNLKSDDITEIEPLLVDVLKHGEQVYNLPGIPEIREQRQKDINRLDEGVKRLIEPHLYHVSLTPKLWQLKQDLIKKAQK